MGGTCRFTVNKYLIPLTALAPVHITVSALRAFQSLIDFAPDTETVDRAELAGVSLPAFSL